MGEEEWQPVVAAALVRALNLHQDHMLAEVQTREGSIIDLLYVNHGRLVAFELKMADPGEVLARLDARAIRQLRHYRAACNAVWLVTLGSPRALTLTHDLRVVVQEPSERQALPEGVGWIIFDQLARSVTVVTAAAELAPLDADRLELCDRVLARLGRVVAATKACRAAAAG